MKVSAQIDSVFKVMSDLAAQQQTHIKQHLKQTCDLNGWLFIDRVKKKESFAQKLETGRFKKLLSIDDMYACTIVVQNLEAIGKAEKLVEKLFEVKKRKPPKKTHSNLSPENFSYDSLRLYCKLIDYHKSTEYGKLIFEVQIKTFLEHAWSVATHDFSYKTGKVTWAKIRLAAQLKAILENVEISIRYANRLSKSKNINKTNKIIDDKNKIIEFYQKNWADANLPANLKRLAECTNTLMKLGKFTLNDLSRWLSVETDNGKGVKNLSMSPYQTIIQTLINQNPDTIKSILSSEDQFYIIITPNMEIPGWLDTKQEKILYISGSELV